jgi:hypothetical protein
MFGATKLFPRLVDSLGFQGTFWMYGGVMAIEVLYGAVSIPENKGESLVKTEDKMLNLAGEAHCNQAVVTDKTPAPV